MLAIRGYQTRQWEIPPAKAGNIPRANETPQQPPNLPVDEVVLQRRGNVGVKEEEEYLVATYWG